ncbi:MAG: hypothetical protein DYH02_08525 [Candidatus Omnitrophica bacterium COP1]|nr:hypothetical protein [Candidatus Omnitrophica bacterium COP1]
MYHLITFFRDWGMGFKPRQEGHNTEFMRHAIQGEILRPRSHGMAINFVGIFSRGPVSVVRKQRSSWRQTVTVFSSGVSV